MILADHDRCSETDSTNECSDFKSELDEDDDPSRKMASGKICHPETPLNNPMVCCNITRKGVGLLQGDRPYGNRVGFRLKMESPTDRRNHINQNPQPPSQQHPQQQQQQHPLVGKRPSSSASSSRSSSSRILTNTTKINATTTRKSNANAAVVRNYDMKRN